ncbi:MAG: hypothetical protein ACOYMN_12705, partial [Roseimicrobium sp.]
MSTPLPLAQSLLLLGAALLPFGAPAQTTSYVDDHANNTTAATLVTAPATIPGVLGHAGDVDYFKVTLANPAVLTATSSGTTDVVGSLLLGGARNAVTEIYSDNDGAGSPNFRLHQLLPAGTHYVQVRPLVYGTLG